MPMIITAQIDHQEFIVTTLDWTLWEVAAADMAESIYMHIKTSQAGLQ